MQNINQCNLLSCYVTDLCLRHFFSDGAQNVIVSGTVLLLYWIIKVFII